MAAFRSQALACGRVRLLFFAYRLNGHLRNCSQGRTDAIVRLCCCWNRCWVGENGRAWQQNKTKFSMIKHDENTFKGRILQLPATNHELAASMLLARSIMQLGAYSARAASSCASCIRVLSFTARYLALAELLPALLGPLAVCPNEN